MVSSELKVVPASSSTGQQTVQALESTLDVVASTLSREETRTLLQDAAASGLPIMVFVGSRGVIQIHTGPVERIVAMDPWINVLDQRFNLHLREDGIASAWIVRKPTNDGVVTALEVFDASGEVIAMLFGKRKPGVPELLEWRELIANVEQDHSLMRTA